MEASPTLRQPLRLSCLRKPPQRLEMFSTTRPWERWTERWGGHSHGTADQLMSQLAQKPSDPALSLRLHNTTEQAHMYIESPAHKYQFIPFTLSLSLVTHLTSISVWKLNKSIFCQLLPSRAKTFHAWEGERDGLEKHRNITTFYVSKGYAWVFLHSHSLQIWGFLV